MKPQSIPAVPIHIVARRRAQVHFGVFMTRNAVLALLLVSLIWGVLALLKDAGVLPGDAVGGFAAVWLMVATVSLVGVVVGGCMILSASLPVRKRQLRC